MGCLDDSSAPFGVGYYFCGFMKLAAGLVGPIPCPHPRPLAPAPDWRTLILHMPSLQQDGTSLHHGRLVLGQQKQNMLDLLRARPETCHILLVKMVHNTSRIQREEKSAPLRGGVAAVYRDETNCRQPDLQTNTPAGDWKAKKEQEAHV